MLEHKKTTQLVDSNAHKTKDDGLKPEEDLENRSGEHCYSTERAHEASEDQGIILASTSKSNIDLDKEFQNNNPDVKPDEDYEVDVTCATPVKYIM